MTGFDDRKKVQETKFAQEEQNKFKICARRRKLLALWAAEITGMDEEDSLNYAIEIVKYGIDHDSFDQVLDKLITDAAKRGAAMDKDQLTKKNAEFAELAKKQVLEQTNS